MSDQRAVSIPAPLHLQSAIIFQEYIGTDGNAVRSFKGLFQVGGSTHRVLIKCRSASLGDVGQISQDLQYIIDEEPTFSGHLFTRRVNDDIVTVREVEECDLHGLVDYPNGLCDFPVWLVVRRCMILVRTLHRSGYCHCGLSAKRFVVVNAGCSLDMRLGGFRSAVLIPSIMDSAASVNVDILRLGNVISQFLVRVREFGPDFVDERFPLLDDLVERIIDTSQRRVGDLELLLSHPAVQPYERCMALACSVSDSLVTDSKGDAEGRQLLEDLDAISGNDFVGWYRRFANEAPEIHVSRRGQSAAPFAWNRLDRLESLQRALRTFRNHTAHRDPTVAETLGRNPDHFTQSWVRLLPRMWISLWRVVSRAYRDRFSWYFRRHD